MKKKVEKKTRKSKYHVVIKSILVDVYDILIAYNVTDPCVQHAIKKLLLPGLRHSKSRLEDLKEARWSIDRAIEEEENKQHSKEV